MSMKFPSGHTPRLSDFSIDGILDETLREGSERCMFSIETESKLPLIRSILKSGVKDLIFGSGPRDPSDLARILAILDGEGALTDQKFSFILLLNCFEPLMEQFERFPDRLKPTPPSASAWSPMIPRTTCSSGRWTGSGRSGSTASASRS